MTNWLEDEEHKQAVQRQRDLQQSELRHLREAEVCERLGLFHSLCTRVKGVRHNALEIQRFRVEGPISQVCTPFKYGERLTGQQRGIRFDCGYDHTSIDAVVTEHFNTGHTDGPYTSDRDIVLVRHACSLQDLSDWREDHILHTVQWMMNETADVKPGLPGREIMNAEGRLVIQLKRRPSSKDPDWVKVFVDGVQVGGVHSSDTTNVGQKGKAFDLATGTHAVTVSDGNHESSLPVHLEAGRVAQFEVTCGFFAGLSLRAM